MTPDFLTGQGMGYVHLGTSLTVFAMVLGRAYKYIQSKGGYQMLARNGGLVGIVKTILFGSAHKD